MATYDLEIKEEDKGNYILVTVSGAINAYTYNNFRDKAMNAIKQKSLVLDLSKVNVLTSTGVGILFELNEQAQKENKKMIILSPSFVVEQVIGLTGFTDLFTFAKDKSEINID